MKAKENVSAPVITNPLPQMTYLAHPRKNSVRKINTPDCQPPLKPN